MKRITCTTKNGTRKTIIASSTEDDVRKLYYDALAGDLPSKDYSKGVVETIDMLIEAGMLKEEQIKEDM